MKVHELISLLQNYDTHQDDEILIKITVPGKIGTGYTKVNGLAIGFDWDVHKVFLVPELKLLRYDAKRE